ncbi:MAG TPA: hypothetical protein VJT67_02705 [Longimicrobiaceae bacterium]|nr:hypothetical protein [Longimicrobiaceae bacterium]
MTSGSDGVHELVQQRDQLRAWIAKLDEVQSAAPSRVTERVRADYQDRLRRVTEDLSAHGEEIRRALDEVRGRLAEAEERRGHAADALEEMRLRHLIGELDEGAWEQARQPLEAESSGAEQAVEQARAEVERLSTLADEIDAGSREPEPEPEPAAAAAPDEQPEPEPQAAEPAPAGEPEDGDSGDSGPLSGEDLAAWISEVEAEVSTTGVPAPPAQDATVEAWDPLANEFGGGQASPVTQPGDAEPELPWLDALEQSTPAAEPDDLAFLDNLDTPAPAADAAPAADLAEDDLAFLEELDRAISGGSARAAAPQTPPPGLSGDYSGGSGDAVGPSPTIEPEGERKQGEALLCKECGAINEPQAWYCEICGSEL